MAEGGREDRGQARGKQALSGGFICSLLGGGPAPCTYEPIFRVGNPSAWNKISCPSFPDANDSVLLSHSISQTCPIIKLIWVLIKNIDAYDPHSAIPILLVWRAALGSVFTMYLVQCPWLGTFGKYCIEYWLPPGGESHVSWRGQADIGRCLANTPQFP